MTDIYLLNHLIENSAARWPRQVALVTRDQALTYTDLDQQQRAFANGLLACGMGRGERVGVFLSKCFETVIATFGAARAGCAFVPVNPVLKAEQVKHIINDCNIRVLVTSPERVAMLDGVLGDCPSVQLIVVVGERQIGFKHRSIATAAWFEFLQQPQHECHRVIDSDIAAILYTSGSTGKPKGVILSHRNMVVGAKSVSTYLNNDENDRLLAVLPLSFDAGFSQLTTAFYVGARVVLLDYLLPNEVVKVMAREKITGLTAVPPLWVQLSELSWPAEINQHLRYIANTGGKMPAEALAQLRQRVPDAAPFLMYGLTEAFRSTYLSPDEVDHRPGSIGKAIPNAEVLVLRQDQTLCEANEPGELVHRGALVSMGYWNDPERTAKRFKPLRNPITGLVMPEIAVFSGDTVRMDEEGYLYFIGRKDEMIKTSGYRLSPIEIEDVLYAMDEVSEVAALGAPHPRLGQGVIIIATAKGESTLTNAMIAKVCREQLPAYMKPAHIDIRTGSLPRNGNGKIDRKSLAIEFENLFTEVEA